MLLLIIHIHIDILNIPIIKHVIVGDGGTIPCIQPIS